MLSQLTTCTSRVTPVLALYFSANCFQNAAVWSLEYSAATSLIEVTFFAPSPDPPAVVPLPLPPPHAESTSAVTPAPAINAVLVRAIGSSSWKVSHDLNVIDLLPFRSHAVALSLRLA